jgi:hypothetical protein
VTEIGGLEAQRDVTALLANFDGNLDRIARINAAVGLSEWDGFPGLFVRKNHGITQACI